MTTHYAECDASGSGLTLVGRLFDVGDDDVLYTSSTAVEQTNRPGKYRFAFTGVAEGAYEFRGFDGGDTDCWGNANFDGVDEEIIQVVDVVDLTEVLDTGGPTGVF